MLKPSLLDRALQSGAQPPSGGCVLKPDDSTVDGKVVRQPPSGGCVLKQKTISNLTAQIQPAAFGRLCVETKWKDINEKLNRQPPSGGCVLKPHDGY